MTFQGHPVRRTVLNGETIEYVADQLVVKLKPNFANDARAQHAVLECLPKHSRFEKLSRGGPAIVQLPEGADPLDMAERLSICEDVEFAEPNFLHSGD